MTAEKYIVIDLVKCRNCDECAAECDYDFHPDNNGIKMLKELAVFAFSCKHCEEGICISACPVDALEKNKQGLISKASNLCLCCRSCVMVCPFGTLMNDFAEPIKSICDYCEIDNNTKTLRCIETCPEKAISIASVSNKIEENIFKLNEFAYVKEQLLKT